MSGYLNPTLEAHQAAITISTVKLTTRKLELLTGFYRDMIGLDVLRATDSAASLGVDGHELLRLQQDASATAEAAVPGLFHTAFLLPDRHALAHFVRHAAAARLQLEGASDHLVSEALYLSDPEGNGIEIYCDRNRSEWPHLPDGSIAMSTDRLDMPSLLALAPQTAIEGPYRMPSGTRIGHVHLCVSDLAEARSTIPALFGMKVMASYPDALFFGRDGYHHHLAANIWRARAGSTRATRTLGLASVTLRAHDPATHAMLRDTWVQAGGNQSEADVEVQALRGLTFRLAPFEAT